MKKILIVLFLFILTINAEAVIHPQRIITDTDGDRLLIDGDGKIGATIASGSAVTIASGSEVKVQPGSTLITGQTSASNNVGVVLGSSAAIKEVQLIAHTDNTNEIYAGPSGVSSSDGVRISSQSYLILGVDNIDAVYIVGDSANKVTYVGIVE